MTELLVSMASFLCGSGQKKITPLRRLRFKFLPNMYSMCSIASQIFFTCSQVEEMIAETLKIESWSRSWIVYDSSSVKKDAARSFWLCFETLTEIQFEIDKIGKERSQLRVKKIAARRFQLFKIPTASTVYIYIWTPIGPIGIEWVGPKHC
jgi:hypothetical protein